MSSAAISGFRKLCFTTLIAVYVLILVGGIVRSSGSGMGCPDWPKCFGSWIPPTDVSQLPVHYKARNAELREKKNQKFVRYLRAVGFSETADKIEHDKSILLESDFNAARTWTEYINRLVGVAIGFLIIALFWRSVSFRKDRPKLFFLSLAILALVLAEGWFGSIVVSTNLTTWTITVHLFLALLMVCLLIGLYHLTEPAKKYTASRSTRWLLEACLVVVLVQLFLGTQVRESVDRLASTGAGRENWVSLLGPEFILHRSYSWVVLLLNAILLLQLRKTSADKSLYLGLIVIILCTLLAGVGMAYGSFPAMLQPLHLVLATGAFGIQLLLFFRLTKSRSVGAGVI